MPYSFQMPVSAEPPLPAPVSRGALLQLRKELGADGLVEAAAIFREEGAATVAAMVQAAARSDADGLRRGAHLLKGGGSNFGAERMGNFCSEIESFARRGELEAAALLLGSLEAEFARVRTALDQECR